MKIEIREHNEEYVELYVEDKNGGFLSLVKIYQVDNLLLLRTDCVNSLYDCSVVISCDTEGKDK